MLFVWTIWNHKHLWTDNCKLFMRKRLLRISLFVKYECSLCLFGQYLHCFNAQKWSDVHLYQTLPCFRHWRRTSKSKWVKEIILILDLTKFKAFADNKITLIQKLKFILERVENIVGSNRIKCWLPAFHPFPTMFSKGFFSKGFESRDCVVKS